VPEPDFVKTGDRVTAADHNELVAAAIRAGRIPVAGAPDAQNKFWSALTVAVRHDDVANQHLAAFSAVKLQGAGSAVASTDSQYEIARNPLLSAVLPGGPGDPVAILAEPLNYQEIGKAVVRGITLCQVAINAPGDSFAYPQAGSAVLMTSPRGPVEILYREAGSSGTKWAIVRVGTDNDPPACFTGYVSATDPDNPGAYIVRAVVVNDDLLDGGSPFDLPDDALFAPLVAACYPAIQTQKTDQLVYDAAGTGFAGYSVPGWDWVGARVVVYPWRDPPGGAGGQYHSSFPLFFPPPTPASIGRTKWLFFPADVMSQVVSGVSPEVESVAPNHGRYPSYLSPMGQVIYGPKAFGRKGGWVEVYDPENATPGEPIFAAGGRIGKNGFPGAPFGVYQDSGTAFGLAGAPAVYISTHFLVTDNTGTYEGVSGTDQNGNEYHRGVCTFIAPPPPPPPPPSPPPPPTWGSFP
jgi:hypothetical protein